MTTATTMRRWMLGVGVFYLVLGIRLLPPINGPMARSMFDSIYTARDIGPDSTAFSFVLDWMGAFGLTLLPLGAVLLVAARDPLRHRLLVHLVIWHELAAGVVGDLWFISRDYMTDAFYAAFILVHLVVVATGIRALRRTPMPAVVTGSTAPEPGERTALDGAPVEAHHR